MMLRKSIFFKEGLWKALQDHMRAHCIESPSIAIEQLIATMLNTTGTENDRNRTATADRG
jgi:hypothetical protein